MTKQTESDENEVYQWTRKELRAEIDAHIKPLEAKAFAAGKLAGIAEEHDRIRESAMTKIAIDRGLITPIGTSATGKSPADLAKRANELQVAALAEGKELSNIEAVRVAYEESGISLR